MKILKPVTNDQWPVPGTGSRSADLVTRHPSLVTCRAFTLVEIAISLAIIGIALVAIVGVLPLGMNVQKENREDTIINQDATVFLEAIRNGSRGLMDLTNYVYFVTNNWALYHTNGAVISSGGNGYTGYPNPSTTIAAGYVTPAGTFTAPSTTITSGTNLVGLLSTPEFTDVYGTPVNNLFAGDYYSNHIVAYVRSISGPAVEKPPQNNPILQEDTFSYRIYCVNAPVANYTPPLWLRQSYNVGDTVSYIFLNGQMTYWQAIFAGQPASSPQPGDEPTYSIRWARAAYQEQLAANLHELRLTFLWPQNPNGKLGTGRQTYRALIAGQVQVVTNLAANVLYFYQPQSFAITK